MNSWSQLLLLGMMNGKYLRLGRPANQYDWIMLWGLTQPIWGDVNSQLEIETKGTVTAIDTVYG